MQTTPTTTRTPQPTIAAHLPAQAGGMLQRVCACGNHADGGECESCKKMRLQRQALTPTHAQTEMEHIPSIVHDVLRSPGKPLDAATRAFMEPRFGHDFSSVRVHADAQATESAQAVNALAYTVGRDVVFGAGQHAPHTNAGRKLMAHELTHVVQQTSYAIQSKSLAVGDAGDSFEVEAERVAEHVAGNMDQANQSINIKQMGHGSVLRRFSSGEHELIGKTAYDKAFSNIQVASTGQPAPPIEESFVRELKMFNFRTKGGRAFTYGQVVAEADNVANFEMMEDERLRRASSGVNIPIISPLLNPVWDWIGDKTHYLDLASRNRAHFHPHNYLSYQPWHWQALKTMNRAWQASQQANQLKRDVRSLLNQYDAKNRRGRQALTELDTLGNKSSPRTAELEREVDAALKDMTALLSQAKQKQANYQKVRIEANNLALRAMAMNGFGDHFLTDAFAAGHIVTPRKQLLDEYTTRFLAVIPVGGVLHCANIPSLAWHDLDNMYGVRVNNLKGDSWLTYGDDYADKDTPKGRSLSPTLQHVVDATATSIGQMWLAAGGQMPADLMPVLQYVPRPTWEHYPGWGPSEWNRQLRFAAGEQIGMNYDAMSAQSPSRLEQPAETVPNPKGNAIGSGLLSARATCLNLISAFGYDKFVVPMIARAKSEYNERYFTGARGQLVSPDEKPVAQESVTGHIVLGSILGGLGGALGGALIGLAVGGPIGALIGGVAGLIVGFLAGGFIGGLTGKRRNEKPSEEKS